MNTYTANWGEFTVYAAMRALLTGWCLISYRKGDFLTLEFGLLLPAQ